MEIEKYELKSELAKKIEQAYYPPEEFVLCLVYAPLGFGKSAYKFKVTVDLLRHVSHLSEDEAWEMLKTLIVFHPEQFFEKLDQVRDLGLPFDKMLILLWDDAGLWLYAMEWDDPFIEAFTKWLNVARTDVTGLLLSTPAVNFLFKKLRNFTSAITVKITKHGADKEHLWRRTATAYLHYLLPDLKKSRVRILFDESFTCRLPDKFFRWYKPLRDAYAKMAKDMMKEKWDELKNLSRTSIDLEQYPELKLPDLLPPKTQWNFDTVEDRVQKSLAQPRL